MGASEQGSDKPRQDLLTRLSGALALLRHWHHWCAPLPSRDDRIHSSERERERRREEHGTGESMYIVEKRAHSIT